MGRPAAGVLSMRLDEGDYIVGMEVVTEDDYMLAVSEKGYGKRTKVGDYRLQSRAGKGVINMKTNDKTGNVLGVLAVKEDTDVILITQGRQDHSHGVNGDPEDGPGGQRRQASDDGADRPGSGGVHGGRSRQCCAGGRQPRRLTTFLVPLQEL